MAVFPGFENYYSLPPFSSYFVYSSISSPRLCRFLVSPNPLLHLYTYTQTVDLTHPNSSGPFFFSSRMRPANLANSYSTPNFLFPMCISCNVRNSISYGRILYAAPIANNIRCSNSSILLLLRFVFAAPCSNNCVLTSIFRSIWASPRDVGLILFPYLCLNH